MRLLEKVVLSSRVFSALAQRRRTPLIAGWNITYRCNLSCRYCASCTIKSKELDTNESRQLIDQIAEAGIKFLVISGGEPLLRGDLGEIIAAGKARGLHVSVNSNGMLLQERYELVRQADEIQLSLDGPAELHNRIRGADTHRKVIEAIELCKQNGMHVNLSAVITDQKIMDIEYLLELAAHYRAGLYFHPADSDLSGDSKKQIGVAPSPEHFRNIIDYLLNNKMDGARTISNSVSGLQHLRHWPQPKDIFCFVALVACFMEPDGSMFVCDSFRNYRDYPTPSGRNVQETFNQLRLPHRCQRCWCGSTVDFNLLGSMKWDALMEYWRRFA